MESVTLRLQEQVHGKGHSYITALLGSSFEDRAWEASLRFLYIGPMDTPISIRAVLKMPLQLIRFLRDVIKISNPDIIIVNWAPLMVLVEIARKWTGSVRAPVIVYERG